MIEKPKSATETILEQYRFVPVAGLDNTEVERRLECFFRELPRAKLDYTAYILAEHGASECLTRSEFDDLCRTISLRPEVFTEFDTDYFNMTLAENIAIARERGSHE